MTFVEYALNVMKEISNTEPAMFQRDGNLFIASKAGFAQLKYGLSIEEDKNDPNPSESIEKSFNAIQKKQERRDEKTLFLKDEEKFYDLISFGFDSRMFTMVQMMTMGVSLSELDDNKIRLIDHNSRYHSHKHGYAMDGTDVWITNARTMPKDEYMRQIIKEENKLIEHHLNLENKPGKPNYFFNPLNILTPYIKISTQVNKNTMHDQQTSFKSWNNKTPLISSKDCDILGSSDEFYHGEDYKNPHGINVLVNSIHINALNSSAMMMRKGREITDNILEIIDASAKSMYMISDIIDKLNFKHYQKYQENSQ